MPDREPPASSGLPPPEPAPTQSSGERAVSHIEAANSHSAATGGDSTPRRNEFGGRDGPEPTRFGDWEKNGRCIDF